MWRLLDIEEKTGIQLSESLGRNLRRLLDIEEKTGIKLSESLGRNKRKRIQGAREFFSWV